MQALFLWMGDLAKSSKHTILLDCADVTRKVAKLFFTGDGSYGITAPYHEAKKVVVFKAEVDYNKNTQIIGYKDTIELSALDDERLKLSHHTSGFVQYSGNGVKSGLDENGQPKGVGLFSSRLENIGSGPAFTLTVQGIEKLETTDKNSKHDVRFDLDGITPLQGSNGINVEGHYFQPKYRRFVYQAADGNRYINVLHPIGQPIRMRVVLAPTDCEYPGFIALELYRNIFSMPEDGFSINGPGEILEPRHDGDRRGILLFCGTSVDAWLKNARSLKYEPRA